MQFVSQLLLLCSIFIMSSALECRINPQDPSKVAYTITVSKSGGANFTTVTDALNSIPSGNDKWIKIFLSPGEYIEKIQIKKDKQCIFLEGQDLRTTKITFDAHARTSESITFDADMDNFIAKGITFQNSFNLVAMDYNAVPAVAFRAMGDKQAFQSCGFVGFQDTLWDQEGRHYFHSCYIEGTVDFIWGSGQSVYERCAIQIKRDGSITAQKRDAATEPSGYVFRECVVYGNGRTVLGRSYGPFSRVIFSRSKFEDVIRPEGWNIWRQEGHEGDVVYAEANCIGPGSNTSGRVPWLKQLNGTELAQYTTQAFINQDGWIEKLPLQI